LTFHRIVCNCACQGDDVPCSDSNCETELSFELIVPAVTVLDWIVGSGFSCCESTAVSVTDTAILAHGYNEDGALFNDCEWSNPNDSDHTHNTIGNWRLPFCATQEPTGDLSQDSGIVAPSWYPEKWSSNNFGCISDEACYRASSSCCSGSPISTWEYYNTPPCTCDNGENHRWYQSAMGMGWNAHIAKSIYNPDKWTLTLRISTAKGILEATRNCVQGGYPYWGATTRSPSSFACSGVGGSTAGWQTLTWQWEWDHNLDPCNLTGIADDTAGVVLVDSPTVVTPPNPCHTRSAYYGYYGHCRTFSPEWTIS